MLWIGFEKLAGFSYVGALGDTQRPADGLRQLGWVQYPKRHWPVNSYYALLMATFIRAE